MKTKTRSQQGFVRASLSLSRPRTNSDGIKTAQKWQVSYNENGKTFVLLELKDNKYEYKGLRFFYESEIPDKYRNEFKEFYDR